MARYVPSRNRRIFRNLMPVDDGPIIDVLYARGPLSAGTLAAEFGDNVPPEEVDAQCLDMQTRGLTEESEAAPRRWQLTIKGAEIGRERKARMSG